MTECAPSACATCPSHNLGNLKRLGVDMERFDYVVALAGNPNVGKSTVFNAATGLRQHTGNWPGKTVSRAEGGFALGDARYKLVDLPGTYSLMSTTIDEEIARNFIVFAQPDVTVVVVDAHHLERNLNLVLQVLEITDRAVICLNLIDEAERHGRSVDHRRLARDLGVPVVPTVARIGRGIDELLDTIAKVAGGEIRCRPKRLPPREGPGADLVEQLGERLEGIFPSLTNTRWVARRLLNGDRRVEEALRAGELPGTEPQAEATSDGADLDALLADASSMRWRLGEAFHDARIERIYTEAARLADRSTVVDDAPRRFDIDRAVDNLVTSRWLGLPTMLALLTVVFWVTIAGANVPSSMLSTLLIDRAHPLLHDLGAFLRFPDWVSGLLFDGVYLATAWVIAVMLPPMAIFFPIFTLLEDFGYLARVSFNLDGLFKRAGAHGKQALTMSMGFGCNAAGVVAARIIDSRRERLIAIITNNFSLCNGRWPTQILIAAIFVGALAPAHLSA